MSFSTKSQNTNISYYIFMGCCGVAIYLVISATISFGASTIIQNSDNAASKLYPYEGDVEEGKKLFWDTTSKAGCAKCHSVGGKGGNVGPGLTSVAATRPLLYILESVLQPSAVIVKGYQSILVLLESGERISGVLKKDTSNELAIGMPSGEIRVIKKSEVKKWKMLNKSIMPSNFAELLSIKDFHDLIAYVMTLKGETSALSNDTNDGVIATAEHSAKVYRLYCFQCHGSTANGRGINAPHLSILPKDHTSSKEMGSLTNEGIFIAIKSGGLSVGRSSEMPPFKSMLTDSEIIGLVKHLRKLCNC
jgi:putative heme-binding domain-containing protein